MKNITRFLLSALCIMPFEVSATPVPTTLGSNLTAFNGSSGATNNNNWNTLMNARPTAPAADFGNCNAIILRCAQPKCSSGGCSSLDIARPIVSGCVQSNANCKQYGDDLIEYISAQLVATSTARANEQSAAAAAAAASAQQQQNAVQMQQLQSQMQNQIQQMQSQMAAANAETVAQLQSALDEQKQLTAAAIAANTASAPATSSAANGLTDHQISAAESGISADVLAREQIAGEVMSKLENAQTNLKKLKATMDGVFEYAGCDKTGNNCTGPKRVTTFKNRAMEFFEPYNDVLNELFDALILAQSVGVDIKDIYMMLNGSCNLWGQYLCYGENKQYNSNNCKGGKSVAYGGTARGGHECTINSVVPPEDDPACTLQKTLTDQEQIRQEWLYAETGSRDSIIRLGCASAALETSAMFRGRKKQASIDIDTLQRIIEQDAPRVYSNRSGIGTTPGLDGVKYCAIGEKRYNELTKAVNLKKLPETICVTDAKLTSILASEGTLTVDTTAGQRCETLALRCADSDNRQKCICEKGDGEWQSGRCSCANIGDGNKWSDDLCSCVADDKRRCEGSGGDWKDNKCDCGPLSYENGECRVISKDQSDAISKSLLNQNSLKLDPSVIKL